MSIAKKARKLLTNLLFGSVRPEQEFFLGQQEPQREITVWLYGLDAPLDVTTHHSMACGLPFTICVAFEKGTVLTEERLRGLSLRFCERDGDRRLLGRIELKYSGTCIPTSGPAVYFFQVWSARSYCLPLIHLWMFYLQLIYRNWRHPLPPNTIILSFQEMRAMEVFFICPRAIGLASVEEICRGNMFPMNVMGQLGDGYFGFGLKDAKSPAQLVDRARRLALSTIPMQQGDLGYGLGPNHSKKNGIDWSDLPFAIGHSPKFGLPFPAFAFRVREMEVEAARKLGSHIFFIGRIVSDQRFSYGIEWCIIHGHYQVWRLKSRPGEIESSLAEDARVKRGMATESIRV